MTAQFGPDSNDIFLRLNCHTTSTSDKHLLSSFRRIKWRAICTLVRRGMHDLDANNLLSDDDAYDSVSSADFQTPPQHQGGSGNVRRG